MSKTALILAFTMLLSFASKAQTVWLRTNLSTAELKELQIIGLQENGKQLIPFSVRGDTVRFEAKGCRRVQLMQVNYCDSGFNIDDLITKRSIELSAKANQLSEVIVQSQWKTSEPLKGQTHWFFNGRWEVFSIPLDLSSARFIKDIVLQVKAYHRDDSCKFTLYGNRRQLVAQQPFYALTIAGSSSQLKNGRSQLHLLTNPLSLSEVDTLYLAIENLTPQTMPSQGLPTVFKAVCRPEYWPRFTGDLDAEEAEYGRSILLEPRITHGKGQFDALLAKIVYR